MDCDIELEIVTGSARGEYTVHVVRAPAGGHASGTFILDVDGIQDRLPQLEATVLASAVAARRTLPVAEVAVREVGQELFQALFTREVYGTYRASLGAAQHAGQQLRVVLRLSAPELAMMPWETLFDPETETYLCQTEPLLRHVPAPDYNLNPLDVAPPLRILGIVASPRDLPALDIQTEKDHLSRALAGPVDEGRVELVWSKTGTWDDVQSMLLAGPWHVVHFVGHGDYDSRTDEGRIALVGPDGRAAMVRAVRLMALLSVASPRPRLVVLNSCSSGEMGQADLFSGTASALVRSGIGAVAAMQFAISDAAAIAFAHGFYAAIANGRTVDEAARVGRISVMASPDGTLEWVTPALYVRGGSTQLFTLKGPPRAAVKQETTAPGRTSGGNVPALDQSTTAVVAQGGQAAYAVGPASDTGTARAAQGNAELAMKRAQLRALYVQASAELRARRYEQAIELFTDLLTLEPGYRDAPMLRSAAQERLEMSRAYRDAVAAEEAGDWLAAADSFARVQDDPAYPDATARKKDCERRQRIADLQGELRYHSSLGSWETVLDVSRELATLDPDQADPDGLASAAREEIEKAKPPEPTPVEPAQPNEPEEHHGSYTAFDPPPEPTRRPGSERPAGERRASETSTQNAPASGTVPGPEPVKPRVTSSPIPLVGQRTHQAAEQTQPPAVEQPQRQRTQPGPNTAPSNPATPASRREQPSQAPPSYAAPNASKAQTQATAGNAKPPDWIPLAWGAASLLVAGVVGAGYAINFIWIDETYSYEAGGEGLLRVVYGLIAPFGYLMLAVAGLPDRSVLGRTVMACLVAAHGVFGLSGLNYTVEATTIIGSLAVAVLGLWAGVLALRSQRDRVLGWLLLLATVSIPLVWFQDKGVFMEAWYRTHAYFVLVQLIILAAVGIGYLVTARRLRAASSERTAP
ncbi:CHAT domain-containing protein [Paenarthrobacter sp. NPDC018779]|uniref:CHAT domain-containing protein n=1 Tax=Paenarthrobacter sp. NPDC018779 TaxID=3364375 RepID=UPI0037C5FF61